MHRWRRWGRGPGHLALSFRVVARLYGAQLIALTVHLYPWLEWLVQLTPHGVHELSSEVASIQLVGPAPDVQGAVPAYPATLSDLKGRSQLLLLYGVAVLLTLAPDDAWTASQETP